MSVAGAAIRAACGNRADLAAVAYFLILVFHVLCQGIKQGLAEQGRPYVVDRATNWLELSKGDRSKLHASDKVGSETSKALKRGYAGQHTRRTRCASSCARRVAAAIVKVCCAAQIANKPPRGKLEVCQLPPPSPLSD